MGIGLNMVFHHYLLVKGYLNGYKRYIDASARNAFTTAAFRFGHSLVPDTINLQNGNNFELSHSFNNNTFTFNPGTYPSDILNGIDTQMSQEVDQNLVSSLSNRLFANPPNYDHGLDLYSRNIMRGRDHGLPSYTQYRAYCNLPSITNFRDLRDVLREGVAETFNLLYRSVDDIDLYPALISEIPDTDGIVGPTLAVY
ncbi:Peroxidasin-like protein [Armadillidium vulgare]|nr:Peroxidasin-like protein [Armadillidium vulgare]